MDLDSRLADVGAIALDDYLNTDDPLTRLHQACKRAFPDGDPIKFEFIEQSTHKQCILTITKPDGARRAYTTQPVFAKKNDAKRDAARIAIDMGALDFIAQPLGDFRPGPSSDIMSSPSDDIEQCCIDWRAGRVTPHWVPFLDAKSPHKQGCALRIQLSPHLARIYLSGSTLDTYLDAKAACAQAAIADGVLDFIKHGNGQTRPPSTAPSLPSQTKNAFPCTLQTFYDSLPRPFPEQFESNDVTQINPLAWMNNMTQHARGGKLVVSFFFTSDGPPGLHGCILKLDRPGEYKAFLVDARFTKRSDAKAAVCLQAMSEGVGDYIRSISSSVDGKITPIMRSFSSNLVYPALTAGLSKIDSDLHLHFEYHKERDAFGATLLIRLSTLPSPHQVRRYAVPSDYRSKADAKVAVICLAAAQGAVEFIRFHGGPVPQGYVSPYSLHTYNPEASKKRKQPDSVEDAEHGQTAKKKKKRSKRRSDAASQLDGARAGQYLLSGGQMRSISRPDDMGLPQSLPMDGSHLSQPGVVGGSGATRPVVHGHGVSLNPHMHAPSSSYPVVLDPRRVGGSWRYGVPATFGTGSRAPGVPSSGHGLSHAGPSSSSRVPPFPLDDGELEPGEVVSSPDSDFSVASSRNDEDDVRAIDQALGAEKSDSDADKGKARATVLPTNRSATSHEQNLMEYCKRRGSGMPTFHEVQRQGRYQVWIVIGSERFDLPTTYATAEEGRQRVAKQVLARLSKV